MTQLSTARSHSKVSLSETHSGFTATVAIPGLTERDIEIRISRDLLSVWSRKPFVGFLRSIPFPENTVPECAEAFVKQSQLIVRVPKVFKKAG